MSLPDPASLPLWLVVLLFTGGAVVVWLAGSRLAVAAGELADRTGLGQAFTGALLLGGITSLPEGATTVSAAAIGNAPLAVNNIFGGIALQVTVLALADWIARGAALSSRVGDDSALLQAALLIAVLGIAALGVILPERVVFGVGLWSLAVFAGAGSAFLLIHRHGDGGWRPRRPYREPRGTTQAGSAVHARSTPALVAVLVVAAAAIFLAGYTVATTADAIAERTGLASGFVGGVAVALATSLPEISTTLGAVGAGAYAMAYGNIFGANILDAAIIFVADIAFAGPAVLDRTDASSTIAAVLGIVLTAVTMVGLVRRRRRIVAGLGLDSAAVLVLYSAGIALLFFYAA